MRNWEQNVYSINSPKYQMKILLGDLNAKVGREVDMKAFN
jgi:hypothetical protein